MMTSPQENKASNRIYWQCRRGMLELDALLQGFLARGYGELDEHQRQVFEALLTTPDNLLLEYLMGRTVPMDPDTANVVKQIRHAAHPQA
jgi:antitoxin CptB